MHTPSRLRSRAGRTLAATAFAALLAACGSDDDSTTLGGTAAVGEPIVGGTVSISCASGSALSTTTSTAGQWQVTIGNQRLPCAAQVQGGTIGGVANGTPLHSIATDFGNLNITPLTDLVVARSVGGNPQAWFAAPAFAGLDSAALQAALAQVRNALGLAGALGDRDPLTGRFEAVTGDPIDDLLQALGAALQALGTDFSALLTAAGSGDFAAFSGLPAALTQALGSTGGDGGGGSTSCTSGVEMVFARGQAAGPYADGQKVCVEASASSLKIDAKTLSNPTVNAVVQPPFAAYVFTDTGLNYEVVLNNGALYEINLAKANAISAADFHGQFTTTAVTGGQTLTVEVAINGLVATSFTVPNQTPPASQADFCADPASDPNLTGIQVQGGITLTITGCSYAGNVGVIQATAQTGGISVPYQVRFIYGS